MTHHALNPSKFHYATLLIGITLSMAGCPSLTPEPNDNGTENSNSANVNDNATNTNSSANANDNAVSGNSNANANSNANRNTNSNSTAAATISANAGPDRTVTDNEMVTLMGGATDSAGAPIDFLWEQTGGGDVAINGATTSMLTFTAPNFSDVLTFRLTATSENGQDTNDVVVRVQAAPYLFVANRGNNSIVSFRADGNLNDDAAPRSTIIGANTRLMGPSSLVIDGIGGILVSNADTNRIGGFLDAENVTGNVVPERFVFGMETALNQPEGLAYDDETDELYVANFDSFPGTINVYSNVSTANFGGPVAPSRQLRSIGIQNARAIQLVDDALIVVNAGAQNLTVFEGAPALNGDVIPSRTLTSDAFTNNVLLDAFVDRENRLYVIDNSMQRILRFDVWDSSDPLTPDAAVSIDGAGTLNGIVVDPAGTGYVSDSNSNAIYMIEALATADGTVMPDRTLRGAMTTLLVPSHMTLLER